MQQCIIVGGGLSGLSAAHTVMEHGIKVVVIDKNSFFGPVGTHPSYTSKFTSRPMMMILYIFASCVMLAQSLSDQRQSTSDMWSDEDEDMGSTARHSRHARDTKHARGNKYQKHHGHRAVGTVAVEETESEISSNVPEATSVPVFSSKMEKAVGILHNDSKKIFAATAKAEALLRESLQTVAALEKARQEHASAKAAFFAANGSHAEAAKEADEVAAQLLKARSTVMEAAKLDEKAEGDNDQSLRTLAEVTASVHMHTTMYHDAKKAFHDANATLHKMNVTAQAAEAEAEKAEKETGDIAMKVQHLTGGTPCPEAAK